MTRSFLSDMSHALEKKGFRKGAAKSFVRTEKDHVLVIESQYGRLNKEVTFNLGFHFSRVPSAMSWEIPSAQSCSVLDCGFRCRIGWICEGMGDVWWSLGSREERVAAIECAVTCGVGALERISESAVDTIAFLKACRKVSK